jgi:pyridoxine 5-phosphate synthase
VTVGSGTAPHEFERIRRAAEQAARLGIECHAGHGLDYATARIIAALPQVVELNIGHFLMGEALFVGLPDAIATMRAAMDAGRAGA